MHTIPYIYSGAISDESIEKVYAGEKQAKIIKVENNKRFWYAISGKKDVKVKQEMKDGTKKTIEEIDEEMLKYWNK